MKLKTKKLVILSDLHVGSDVALWPKDFVSEAGVPIGMTDFQKWLHECWTDCLKWITKATDGKPFDLLFNGDLVEGIHHRTIQIMTPNVADQSEAVRMLIEPLTRKAAATYYILGTECHTRNDEMRISRMMGGRKDPSTGQHAFNRMEAEFGSTLVAAAHHMPATSRPYLEASAHGIVLGAEIQERARCGKRPPDVVVHAHRHTHGVWSDGMKMSMSTGAWQGLTRHGNKVVPHAIPRPSCIILDREGKEDGELPRVEERLYIA